MFALKTNEIAEEAIVGAHTRPLARVLSLVGSALQ